MSRTVDADIAGILEGAGLGLSTSGSPKNLFTGPMPGAEGSLVADESVAVLETGGPLAHPYIGGGRKTYRQVTCQVMVRSDPQDWAGGLALARGVYDALQLSTLSPYVQITIREGAPFYGGRDEQERHQWAMNVVAEYEDDGP